MGLRTYQIKTSRGIVLVKAKKAAAESFGTHLQSIDPSKIIHYFKQLSGHTDDPDNQRESILWSPFQSYELRDVDGYHAALDKLYESLPDPVTREDMPPILAQINAIIHNHAAIEDNRTTPEERAETAAIVKEAEREREEKRAAFLSKYSQPDAESLPVPNGKMAVVIKLCYDNSDIMTDYFSCHASVPNSEPLLLAFVKDGARTERLARQVLARYPELNALSWSWHTQNYSMGHGNWLESGAIGKVEGKTTYGGLQNPPFWYEVSFTWGGVYHDIYPWRDYPGVQNAASPPRNGTPHAVTDSASFDLDDPESGVISVEVTNQGSWTWVKFSEKPARVILDLIKSSGARFSRRRLAWYFTKTLNLAEVRIILTGA